MEYAILSPTKQFDDDIKIIRAGLAKFDGGIVWLPLKTADVSDTGSMTEVDPVEEPGTKDYSQITREFSVQLMDEYVNWICRFLEKFETMTVPPINVSGEEAMKALKS
jgi:hypothetical protein